MQEVTVYLLLLLFFFQRGKDSDTLFFKDGKRRVGECTVHFELIS